MTAIEPGWYPDPGNAGRLLFWSGTNWAGERLWTGTAWAEPPAPPPWNGAPAGVASAWPAATTARPPLAILVRNRAVLTIAGAALMLIGSMLPWARQNYVVTTTSVNGTSAGGGQFSIVLAIAAGGLAALILARIIGPRKGGVINLVLGLIAIAVCIANMSNISGVIDKEKASGVTVTGAGTTYGPGLFVLLVGDVIVIVAALLTIRSGRRTRV